MLMMKFEEYETNKFMAMNATTELDIVVTEDSNYPYLLASPFDKYSFETWEEAVMYAEHKYGIEFKL